MIKITALREQRSAKAKDARNLLDTNTGDKWSKDVEAQVDACYAEIDRIDAQIERLEKQAKIDGDQAEDEGNADVRDRALHNLAPEARERQVKYSAAFRNFLVNGVNALTGDEMQMLRTGIQNAQSGQQANGAQGGYLVPTGWGAQLLEALKAFGGMRAVATVFSTEGGNPIPFPTVDETASEGEIVAESVAATSQDMAFGTTSIGAFKWSSKKFAVPFELLQDQGPGIDIEAFIRRAAATRIARIQNKKYTIGTGTGEPQGIVTAAAAGKVGATGTTVDVGFDDLIDLEHSVDPAYRSMPGVGYMFHDTTLRTLKKKKDAEGRPIWLPGYDVKEPDVINGWRYTVNQDMPVMAANAKSIVFGKLDEYMIRDIMQVTLFRFDDSAFISLGQIGFLAWARGDGKLVTGGQPVKYFQNSAT